MLEQTPNTYYKVQEDALVDGIAYGRPKAYGDNATDDYLYSQGWARLWVDNGGDKPGDYYTKKIGTLTVANNRVERVDYWEVWEDGEIRESLLDQIGIYRVSGDIKNIDLDADSGRAVLMTERNVLATSETERLGATPDEDVGSFVLDFNPQHIGSIATAGAMYAQEKHILLVDPTLTPEQTTELEDVAAAHATIASGTDDAVEVPKTPAFARLRVGVVAEGYGKIWVRRVQSGVNWGLVFRLETDRELSVSDYWVAVYSNGTYLATPFLNEIDSNTYETEPTLWTNDTETPYEYTLCYTHISKPQFTPVSLAPGVLDQFTLIRWGGNATASLGEPEPAADTGEWVDTGQTISYVGAKLIRIGSTAAFAVGDRIRFNDQPLVYVIQSVHSIQDLILDIQPPASAAGDTVFLWT